LILFQYCKGIIIGKSKQIREKQYHFKCFICTGCSKLLGENDWKERNGWPWCISGFNCYENANQKFTLIDPEKEKESEKHKWLKEQEQKLKEIGPQSLGKVELSGKETFELNPLHVQLNTLYKQF